MVWYDAGNYQELQHTHDWIIALFDILPSSRTLRRISLENHFRRSLDLISWTKGRRYRLWQVLDEYSSQGLHDLEIFTLEIGIPDEWKSRVLASCLKSEKYFSKLRGKGIFKGVEIKLFEPYFEW